MGKTKAYPIFFREDDEYYLIYIPDFDVVSEVDELDIAKVIQVSRCLIKDICKLKKEKNIKIPEPSNYDNAFKITKSRTDGIFDYSNAIFSYIDVEII